MPDPKPKSTLKKKADTSEEGELFEVEEKTLLFWESPSRPFKKYQKEYFNTAGTIVGLVIVILLFLKEILLIGVILALCFTFYVLATIPPKEIKNKITTHGVYSGDHFYPWEQLDSFWFDESRGQGVLNIATYLRFPTQLFLVLGKTGEKKLKDILGQYLRFSPNPPRSFLDEAADWLGKRVPLEKAG